MNKIKKIIFCILALVVCVACDEKSLSHDPQTVTNYFLLAYQSGDITSLKKYSLWDEESIQVQKIQKQDLIDGIDSQLQTAVYKKMFDFRYKILKEHMIDDQHASVDVEIVMNDFSHILEVARKQAQKLAQELVNKGESDEIIKVAIYQSIFENLQQVVDQKTYVVSIKLIYQNKQWFVDEDNEELYNILVQNINCINKL